LKGLIPVARQTGQGTENSADVPQEMSGFPAADQRGDGQLTHLGLIPS